MERKVIARWESKSGKHWVEVYDDNSYHSPGASGYRNSEGDVLEEVERLVNMGGFFQPDSNKTPMKRVI